MSYYRQGPPPGSGFPLGVPQVTPMMRSLMIATGAVWLLQILLGSFGFRLFGLGFEEIFGVVPLLFVRGMLWQPLTYVFLHSPSSLMHILFNMLFVWMFGGDLERLWGGREFLRYYLITGAGGGVLAALMGLAGGWLGSPADYYSVTIGASGAVFGLITAFGMIFGERTVLFMLLFPMKARTMAMILFAIAFFYTFTGGGGNVSHVGHLGGALVGFLYLKRAWRVGAFYREIKWRIRRRRFKVLTRDDRKDDFDRWVH
ncbi:MAG TPA: rhomboid family intramembrane serine protease [Candidatus Polarisedimenticolaceae bacterium]|nr:rhomboid family intramembrane serine protease [Candidatus Polarisedimenticolaceae bacterium]